MKTKNEAAQALGRLGGKSRSEAKIKAAQENVKKATLARIKKQHENNNLEQR